ncbi:MAG TPA: helix-turn-helix domain-containing protein [Patescibacteria group bacterium]|nr:helix-turn-helix domain-containing protein [Patescibacteria group bacterium]
MDIQLLEDTGLTKPQARAYAELVKDGACAAPAVGVTIGESRSNAYKVLDKLCELGLATKGQTGKKVRYYPTSPTALEQLVQQQAAQLQQRERKLKAGMPDLMHYYFKHSEQPSVRFYQGMQGIERIFNDMLATGRDIYLLRSPADVDFYQEGKFFTPFRKKRALLGITTYALTVDVPSAIHNQEEDFKNKFVRTWLPPQAYTAPVEWDIYGDKVALISYGKEAIGVVIESPQIAESFRQMFQLATAKAVASRAASRAK